MKNLYKRFRYRNIKLIMDEDFNEYILVLDPKTILHSGIGSDLCILKYSDYYSEEGLIAFCERVILK